MKPTAERESTGMGDEGSLRWAVVALERQGTLLKTPPVSEGPVRITEVADGMTRESCNIHGSVSTRVRHIEMTGFNRGRYLRNRMR